MSFFRIEPEVAGGMGPNTELDRSTHPPLVTKLHYVFEGWLGDALLETFPCFLVTADLGRRLEEAGLSGFELADVEIGRSPEFEEMSPGRVLPEFRWLRLRGVAGQDDFAANPGGRLVVSRRALDVLQASALKHADIEPA